MSSRDFDDGRHELQDDQPHDGLDAVAAALEHARQPAGLALEMKAQRQLVHVDECQISEPAHRVHRHLGEDAVAPLREQRHQHAHAAVGERHDDRRRDQPHRPVRRAHRRLPCAGQRIDRPFEGERHAMVATLASSNSTIDQTTRIFRSARSPGQM